MTLLVPFDGSDLAEAALVRAAEFGAVFEEDVLAVSVVPKGNAAYARERGWIDPGEAFDTEAIVSRLHEEVTSLTPTADFRHRLVGQYATAGTISNRVRQVAKAEDASMVFVGSENAGRMVTGLGSVGGGIATDAAYDVVIVRHRSPSKISKLKDTSPTQGPKSDSYAPE